MDKLLTRGSMSHACVFFSVFNFSGIHVDALVYSVK